MPFAPKHLAAALAVVLGTAAGSAAAQVPAGYPGLPGRHRRREEGRQADRLLDDRHGPRAPADQGLRKPVRREGRVQRHEQHRAVQPLHQRERGEQHQRRRAVELGDGPAGQARQRRPDGVLRFPESANLPQWAQYQKQAYGTTFEPLAIVYNKRLIPENEVPKTRAELIKLLASQPDKFRASSRRTTSKSGVGFNALTQDAHLNEGHVGTREGDRRDRPEAAVEHRRDDGAHLVGREPDRLQHLRIVRVREGKEGQVDRLRVSEGLHRS